MSNHQRSPLHRLVINVLWRLVRSVAYGPEETRVPLGAAIMVAGGIADALLGDEQTASDRLRRAKLSRGVVALRLAQAVLREAAELLDQQGRRDDANALRDLLARVVAPIMAEASR